ncbi:3-phosphoglycerate dehydrogenase [bacterium]|nr:3-phosphoglycerate dehydrogenase [bacterium]
MPTVLCTALNTNIGPHIAALQAVGFDVVIADCACQPFQAARLLEQARGVSAVIAGSEPWPRSLIEQLPDLRVLSRTGVGFDAIDLAACNDRRIVVATTPGVNHHAVAEQTLAMLLGIVRGYPRRDQVVRSGTWERFSTPRLMGQTVGVVGLGRIGQAVVQKLAGFGVKLLGYDPYANPQFVAQHGIQMVSLPELYRQADYLSLHVPVTPETRHMINAETLATMKPTAVLINTARGALVDEAALYTALSMGKLRAAALDVFEVEPLPLTSPLLTLPNVLLSGHIAGLDNESQFDTLTMAADTIIQLKHGHWPQERIQNLRGVTEWTW